LRALGFEVVRESEHISILGRNRDGTHTLLTIANQSTLKFRSFCRNSMTSAMSVVEIIGV